MRVLMMVDAIGEDAGGGERMASGLAQAVAEAGEEVTLCVTRGVSASDAAPLRESGVRVLGLERRSALHVTAWRPLLRLMADEPFDVLHAHKFGSNVWGVPFGRLRRVPVVIAHEQTWSYRGNPARRAIDWVIGRACSAFVAVSSLDRRRMIELERIPAEKVVMIPNAHVPRPEAPGPGLREELGLGPEVPIVGTAAVMRPQKALEVLVEAFARVASSHPATQLVLGGDGERRPALESLAADRGLSERVRFLGMREDVPRLLQGFDIAAMSSDFEGTPLFALECMASGTPLVATEVGGLPDLVTDGESALLVPPRDSEALAGALDSLLTDPALRERIGRSALERSREFSLPRTAERFIDLYRGLLDESGRAS
jgi:glycosyltransferase involved in cell wall biosynthesis